MNCSTKKVSNHGHLYRWERGSLWSNQRHQAFHRRNNSPKCVALHWNSFCHALGISTQPQMPKRNIHFEFVQKVDVQKMEWWKKFFFFTGFYKIFRLYTFLQSPEYTEYVLKVTCLELQFNDKILPRTFTQSLTFGVCAWPFNCSTWKHTAVSTGYHLKNWIL